MYTYTKLKENPQYAHFRCGLLYLINFLENIRKRYKLQPISFGKEIEHDEIFEDIREEWEK